MEILLILYGITNKVVNWLITPFLYLYFDVFGKQDKLPPIKNPILEICAVDLAEKIRNRQVNVNFLCNRNGINLNLNFWQLQTN